MTLRAALRERALLAQAFGVRAPRIKSAPQVRPASFARAAHMAYLRGLLDVVGAVDEAIKRHVLPELPRLIAAHAASRPVLDARDRQRIAIVGAPRAGKTTLARELAVQLGLPVHSSDDLIALGWSEASSATADMIEAAAASGGVFEGVAVIRALRKLAARRPDKPVDAVMVMHIPRQRWSAGQAAMAAGVRTIVQALLPELQARGVEVYHDEDVLRAALSERHDAVDDDPTTELFELVGADVNAKYPETRIGMLAQDHALRVDEHVKGQITAQVRQVVAIDLNAPDTGVPQHVRNFVAQQITLIKGLSAQTIAKTHAVVLEGVRQGLRAEEIAKQLQEQVKLSKTRATIIANDQVSKLHGELTRLRQTSLGIKRYRWATSRDELVRPGHRALQGTIQSWDSPPIVNPTTGKRAHPGMDTHFYPCRCNAIPIIEDLLEDAGLTTLPPPAPSPANTNTPANTNAKPKRAKPTPKALPPEHTPQHWVPQYRAQYGDAAAQVAWGRAMAERGRALSLDEFKSGAAALRKRGIDNVDPDTLLYVKEAVAQHKPVTLGELLDVLERDPDISDKRRVFAREFALTGKLVAHHKALAGAKQLKRITLVNDIEHSTKSVTRKVVEDARRRARTIYESMSSKRLEQPVAYTWRADHVDRAGHNTLRINFGASERGITPAKLIENTLHEWGHAIETLNEKRLTAAVDFLEARAGSERARSLNEITKSRRFQPNERAIEDKLFDPYMGKEYKGKHAGYPHVRERHATEVTSMAAQHMHDVAELQREVGDRDPEAIDWLLGQLADQ